MYKVTKFLRLWAMAAGSVLIVLATIFSISAILFFLCGSGAVAQIVAFIVGMTLLVTGFATFLKMT